MMLLFLSNNQIKIPPPPLNVYSCIQCCMTYNCARIPYINGEFCYFFLTKVHLGSFSITFLLVISQHNTIKEIYSNILTSYELT